MAKKLMTALIAVAFVASMGSVAVAKTYKGSVTSVKGNLITVELSKKHAKKFAEGDSVSLKVKKSAARAGSSALTGC